jgi:hypothetical protein
VGVRGVDVYVHFAHNRNSGCNCRSSRSAVGGSSTHPSTRRAAGGGGYVYACGPVGRCVWGGCGMLLVVTRAEQDMGFA